MLTENKALNVRLVIGVDSIVVGVELHCGVCGVSVTARVPWRQYRAMEAEWMRTHDHVNEQEAEEIYKEYAPVVASGSKRGD